MKLSDTTLNLLKDELPVLMSRVNDDTLRYHYRCSFCSAEADEQLVNGRWTLAGVKVEHNADCLGVRLLAELDSQE